MLPITTAVLDKRWIQSEMEICWYVRNKNRLFHIIIYRFKFFKNYIKPDKNLVDEEAKEEDVVKDGNEMKIDFNDTNANQDVELFKGWVKGCKTKKKFEKAGTF